MSKIIIYKPFYFIVLTKLNLKNLNTCKKLLFKLLFKITSIWYEWHGNRCCYKLKFKYNYFKETKFLRWILRRMFSYMCLCSELVISTLLSYKNCWNAINDTNIRTSNSQSLKNQKYLIQRHCTSASLSQSVIRLAHIRSDHIISFLLQARNVLPLLKYKQP